MHTVIYSCGLIVILWFWFFFNGSIDLPVETFLSLCYWLYGKSFGVALTGIHLLNVRILSFFLVRFSSYKIFTFPIVKFVLILNFRLRIFTSTALPMSLLLILKIVLHFIFFLSLVNACKNLLQLQLNLKFKKSIVTENTKITNPCGLWMTE